MPELNNLLGMTGLTRSIFFDSVSLAKSTLFGTLGENIAIAPDAQVETIFACNKPVEFVDFNRRSLTLNLSNIKRDYSVIVDTVLGLSSVLGREGIKYLVGDASYSLGTCIDGALFSYFDAVWIDLSVDHLGSTGCMILCNKDFPDIVGGTCIHENSVKDVELFVHRVNDVRGWYKRRLSGTKRLKIIDSDRVSCNCLRIPAILESVSSKWLTIFRLSKDGVKLNSPIDPPSYLDGRVKCQVGGRAAICIEAEQMLSKTVLLPLVETEEDACLFCDNILLASEIKHG